GLAAHVEERGIAAPVALQEGRDAFGLVLVDDPEELHEVAIALGGAGEDAVLALAGLAPRGPEVHHDWLAAERGEGDGFALVVGAQGEGRRLPTHQRGAQRAGIVAEALGEEEEQRQDDEQAADQDPSVQLARGLHAPTSNRGVASSSSLRGRVRAVEVARRREGQRASAAPSTITPAPSQIQTTAGLRKARRPTD